MAECLGLYTAAPIPFPTDPIFRDMLAPLPYQEQRESLGFLRDVLVAQVKVIDAEMEKTKP
jgi:hypothetical protein